MPGLGTRIAFAFRCFFSMLFSGELPDDVIDRVRPAPEPAAAAVPRPAPVGDSSDRAVQLLAFLQRDGRLIDFLQEDIGGYGDAQIGAAVRDVHEKCRATLGRYLTLEPVVSEAEGDRIQLGTAVDPARMKLVGAVSARGSLQGIVRHRGWRVTHAALPSLSHETGRDIIAPAEIEVE